MPNPPQLRVKRIRFYQKPETIGGPSQTNLKTSIPNVNTPTENEEESITVLMNPNDGTSISIENTLQCCADDAGACYFQRSTTVERVEAKSPDTVDLFIPMSIEVLHVDFDFDLPPGHSIDEIVFFNGNRVQPPTDVGLYSFALFTSEISLLSLYLGC